MITTIEEAKKLGEFVGTFGPVNGEAVEATFMRYEPGARSGKFHKYQTVTVSREVAEQLENE